MNAFQLKVLAILSMLLAHIDVFFSLQSIPLFIFGRLAFPIFSFLIANGAHHTKSLRQYVFRIFIFALISQVPYVLVQRIENPVFWELNILFTLFFGLCAISLFKFVRPFFLKWGGIVLVLIIADALLVDYGLPGVLSVLLFYIFYTSKVKMIISQILVFVILHLVHFPTLDTLLRLNNYYILHVIPLALLALIPIYLYNGNEGRKMQYLFYVFYPLHLVVIYLILLYL